MWFAIDMLILNQSFISFISEVGFLTFNYIFHRIINYES